MAFRRFDPLAADCAASQAIDLSLDRMWRILAALGHPERRLPPVIHVAGTNGKGSTIAFMRAILEAGGLARARLYLPASRALQRAIPAWAVKGGAAGRPTRSSPPRWRNAKPPTPARPSPCSRSPRRRHFFCSRAIPPTCCSSKSGWAAGSMPPMSIEQPLVTVITPVSFDHAEFLGDTLGADRGREGRHPQARRAGDRGGAAARGAGRDRAAGGAAARRRSGLPARTGRQRRSAAVSSIRTMPGCSTFRRRNSMAGISSRMPGWPLRRCARSAVSSFAPAAFERRHCQGRVAGAHAASRAGRLAALAPPGSELWLDGGHNADGGRAIAECARRS